MSTSTNTISPATLEHAERLADSMRGVTRHAEALLAAADRPSDLPAGLLQSLAWLCRDNRNSIEDSVAGLVCEDGEDEGAMLARMAGELGLGEGEELSIIRRTNEGHEYDFAGARWRSYHNPLDETDEQRQAREAAWEAYERQRTAPGAIVRP